MGMLGTLFKISSEVGLSGLGLLSEVSQDVEVAAVAGMNAIGDTAAGLAEETASLAEKIYQKHVDVTQDVVENVLDSATVTLSEILKRLPVESAADMPPEVQSLIEVRGADHKLSLCFAELREQGGLDEVVRYLETRSHLEELPAGQQAQPGLDPGERPEIKFSPPALG